MTTDNPRCRQYGRLRLLGIRPMTQDAARQRTQALIDENRRLLEERDRLLAATQPPPEPDEPPLPKWIGNTDRDRLGDWLTDALDRCNARDNYGLPHRPADLGWMLADEMLAAQPTQPTPEEPPRPSGLREAVDTATYLDIRDTIGFLRSCVRSGESLDAADDARIDAALDRLRETVSGLTDEATPPSPRSSSQCPATTSDNPELRAALDKAARFFHGAGPLLLNGSAGTVHNVPFEDCPDRECSEFRAALGSQPVEDAESDVLLRRLDAWTENGMDSPGPLIRWAAAVIRGSQPRQPANEIDDAVRGALHDYWTRRYGPSYDHDKTDGDAIELTALIRTRLASQERSASEAGRVAVTPSLAGLVHGKDIAAIEQEARAALLAELAAKVVERTKDDPYPDSRCFTATDLLALLRDTP